MGGVCELTNAEQSLGRLDGSVSSLACLGWRGWGLERLYWLSGDGLYAGLGRIGQSDSFAIIASYSKDSGWESGVVGKWDTE